jgi:hypothetical protein
LLIRRAIFRHSSKAVTDDPYDEVLKDADVLQRYLHDTGHRFAEAAFRRVVKTAAEVGKQGLSPSAATWLFTIGWFRRQSSAYQRSYWPCEAFGDHSFHLAQPPFGAASSPTLHIPPSRRE